MMKRLLILPVLLIAFVSCGPNDQNKDWEPQTKAAKTFTTELVLGHADKVAQMMDDVVLGSVDIEQLKGVIMASRQTMVDRFGEGIPQMELVTAAPITYDGLPANLVVLKVESLTAFGFYDFILNVSNNKVILFESKGRVYLK